jgi:putative oxidoreductase
MSGRYVKLAAFGFVIYVLLVNILLHPFWAVESEMQNFFKNMGILSGLLILAGHTPSRKPALKDWWKSDAAIARE